MQSASVGVRIRKTGLLSAVLFIPSIAPASGPLTRGKERGGGHRGSYLIEPMIRDEFVLIEFAARARDARTREFIPSSSRDVITSGKIYRAWRRSPSAAEQFNKAIRHLDGRADNANKQTNVTAANRTSQTSPPPSSRCAAHSLKFVVEQNLVEIDAVRYCLAASAHDAP